MIFSEAPSASDNADLPSSRGQRAARPLDTVASLTTYVPDALQRLAIPNQHRAICVPPRLIRISGRVPIDSQEPVQRVGLSRGDARRLARILVRLADDRIFVEHAPRNVRRRPASWVR